MFIARPDTMRRRRKKSGRGGLPRSGAATVELAMILPMFLILALGTIELCQYFFLRQSAAIVAYEGARLAVRSRVDAEMVRDRCETMLEQRRIVGGTVQVTPDDLLSLPSASQVEVRIEVPHAQNSPTFFVLRNAGTITVTATMLRE